jgi:peptide/nickel transport system substrate-binding protein
VDVEGLSRDEFLRRSAAAGGVLLGGSLLSRTAEAAQASAPAAKKGGVLMIGCGGGGKATDTLDADNNVGNEVDIARGRQLYDQLFDRAANFALVDKLAEEATPNATGDVWTVRLRKGVEFHNGKSLTADDLIFSITRNFDPKLTFSNYKTPLSFLNIKNGIKKLDPLTVRFTLSQPNAIFRERMGFPIIPIGYNGKQPVGTGPFMYKTFTPGVESTMDANKNYWGKGPYADQVVITNISDDTARVNALLSGQVHAINALPYAQYAVIAQHSNLKPLVARAGTWRPITMRVDSPPFNDNRVREAFRLIVDRPQMLTQAIGGHGRIANDLYSPVDPCFASELPQRHQDIPQAMSLLKAAGQENLTITMTTAPVNAGVVEMSQVCGAGEERGRHGELEPDRPGDVLPQPVPQVRLRRLLLDIHPSLPAAGGASGQPKGNLQRDPFRGSDLRQALQRSDPDCRRRETLPDHPCDAEDPVREGRLHHPLLPRQHRRLLDQTHRPCPLQNRRQPRRLAAKRHLLRLETAPPEPAVSTIEPVALAANRHDRLL